MSRSSSELKKCNAEFEVLKIKILDVIPKGRVSEVTLIKSFEKVNQIIQNSPFTFVSFEIWMLKIEKVSFSKIDSYFKKVHKIIRKKGKNSKFFNENLRVIALSNFEENSGFYFGIKDITKAYNFLLDHYDPNKTQGRRPMVHLNWSGFWSLIPVKNGKIEGCYLGDSYDRDLFYEYLNELKEKNSK